MKSMLFALLAASTISGCATDSTTESDTAKADHVDIERLWMQPLDSQIEAMILSRPELCAADDREDCNPSWDFSVFDTKNFDSLDKAIDTWIWEDIADWEDDFADEYGNDSDWKDGFIERDDAKPERLVQLLESETVIGEADDLLDAIAAQSAYNIHDGDNQPIDDLSQFEFKKYSGIWEGDKGGAEVMYWFLFSKEAGRMILIDRYTEHE